MRARACVIGDLSLVRALGRRSIPVVVATDDPQTEIARSRWCEDVVETPSFLEDPLGAVRAIAAWARTEPVPPVVFYQGDHDLLALSRHREELAGSALVLLPPAELVEDLVDKLRFAAFAERRGLPVPRTAIVRRDGSGAASWDRFPCVLKPAIRANWFGSAIAGATRPKAVRIDDRAAFDRVVPLLSSYATDFVLQEAIEGGEDRIASWHAYVREGGEIVAEFTGKKIRTTPRCYGLSSCVEITDDAEVKRAGRDVLAHMRFHGVLKMDFKRDPDGRLYLLEVNPRFSLWHHPATLAGVCLPELVYRDCVDPGSARANGAVQPGVRWVSSRQDLRAMREYRAAGELTLVGWLAQLATTDVDEDLCLSDPIPTFVAMAHLAERKLSRK